MKHLYLFLIYFLVAAPVYAQTWTFDDPANPGIDFSDPIMGLGWSEVRVAEGNGYVTLAAEAVQQTTLPDGSPTEYFQEWYGIFFPQSTYVHAFNIAATDGPGRVWPEGQKIVNIQGWSQDAADPSSWHFIGQMNVDVTSTGWNNWQTVVVDWPGVKALYVSNHSYYDVNNYWRTYTTSLDNITDGIVEAVRPSGKPCKDSPGKGKGVPGGKACVQP
ncbi:MAG: hypothetical protein OEV28_13995 [Nitrospirota bacterium]|nr:hypothetical protein [Nitrospirota bacterium]